MARYFIHCAQCSFPRPGSHVRKWKGGRRLSSAGGEEGPCTEPPGTPGREITAGRACAKASRPGGNCRPGDNRRQEVHDEGSKKDFGRERNPGRTRPTLGEVNFFLDDTPYRGSRQSAREGALRAPGVNNGRKLSGWFTAIGHRGHPEGAGREQRGHPHGVVHASIPWRHFGKGRA